MSFCDRCKCESTITTGSMFNTQMICPTCEDTEKAHTDYSRARKIEGQEVLRGNYNFKGVGLPSDLG